MSADPVQLKPVAASKGKTIPNTHPRNDGMKLDLSVIEDIRMNLSAIEQRTATLSGRRSVKKDWQAAWLLKSITCMDLTTLSGDDTPDRVKRLCTKAANPVRADLLDAIGFTKPLHTGAVCVYHAMVPTAVKALEGTDIPVAAVSTGFPHGLSPMSTKLQEIRESVAAGAKEIDIVITRQYVLTQNWDALYDEMKQYRDACGDARIKAILAVGELATMRNIAKASMVCMMAGADFIKTSTGKEATNANLNNTLAMIRMIRQYQTMTGFKVGYKPAGGISKAKDALMYQALMKDELGREWLEPELFRFGVSSLLGDVERQIEHFVTGHYSASNRHPIG